MRRLLTLSLVLASVPALAQEGVGPYVGIGVGQIDYEDAYAGRLDYGDTDSSVSLRGGFKFNQTFALEGVYSTTSSYGENKSGPISTFRAENGIFFGGPGGDIDGRVSGEIDYFELRVIAYTGNVMFGFGLHAVDIKGTFSGTTQFSNPDQPAGATFVSSLDDSDNGFSYLIGAHFSISDNWRIRAEYHYFDMDSPADATVLGVGIQYEF